MKSHRLARVSEVIREVAANTILFDLRDPRIKNVTVTRAEVSGDLQHAKVFVSVMGTEKEQQLAMHGLDSAAGYVQTKVAKQLTSRYVPHVQFVLDLGVKKAIEIARLIRESKSQLGMDEPADDSPADEDLLDEDDDTDGDEVDDAPGSDENDPAAGDPPRA